MSWAHFIPKETTKSASGLTIWDLDLTTRSNQQLQRQKYFDTLPAWKLLCKVLSDICVVTRRSYRVGNTTALTKGCKYSENKLCWKLNFGGGSFLAFGLKKTKFEVGRGRGGAGKGEENYRNWAAGWWRAEVVGGVGRGGWLEGSRRRRAERISSCSAGQRQTPR